MMTTNTTVFKRMGNMLSLVFSDYSEARTFREAFVRLALYCVLFTIGYKLNLVFDNVPDGRIFDGYVMAALLWLHEQHDLHRRLPDDAALHGYQTGYLIGHRHHCIANLSRTQSVPHRQDGCNSHKCEFLSKKRDVVMHLYRRIVKKTTKCFVISKQIITFAPTK